jgi:hypothetical protein
MTPTPRRRPITLLAISACVLLPLSGAAALGAGHLSTGHTGRSDAASRESAWPFDTALPRVGIGGASWSSGPTGDVITVAGTRCPKSHPRKIGSSTSASWSQVAGKLTHRSRHSVICAR